jgi:hypothetical protein
MQLKSLISNKHLLAFASICLLVLTLTLSSCREVHDHTQQSNLEVEPTDSMIHARFLTLRDKICKKPVATNGIECDSLQGWYAPLDTTKRDSFHVIWNLKQPEFLQFKYLAKKDSTDTFVWKKDLDNYEIVGKRSEVLSYMIIIEKEIDP